MLFTQHPNSSAYFIKSYHPNQLVVDKTYIHSIILSSTQLIDDWPPQTIEELKTEDIDMIIQQNPELVLLGTGNKHHFIHPYLLKNLMARHIGFEIMSTSAACRTYDVLVSEGRHVVAGLLIR